MRKQYALFLILIGFTSCSFAADEYKIDKVLHEDHFIINGLHWKKHDNCPAFQKGDKVTFVHGNANGQCVVATIMHHESNSTCNLWCHDARSDG